jgi:O-antigen/teichoic acid export membrane protein
MPNLMLAKSATSSFNWNLAGSVVRYGTGFFISIVLARILGPEPYGLVAIATIFIAIGNLIIDSGLNSGLIQKQEITNEDIHYIFTIQLGMGLLITVLISGLAPLVAALYRQPEVTPVLQVLSITSVLQAAAQTSTALLKRRLQFNRIQHVSVTSYLLGYLGIGLWLAVTGYGVWSLVFAQLSTSTVYLALVYAVARHSIRLKFRDPNGISRFGLKIFGTNIANWLISNYDNTSIGWVYGATSLGFYSRAWTLAMTPVQMVVTSAQTVLFSATSKLSGSAERARNTFVGIFTLFGITFFPFSLFESLVASDLVQFLYGDKWNASAPILSILSLAMPFFALMALEGPVLAGLGKPEIELKIQWLVLGFTLMVLLFAIHFPLHMIVWSVVVIYIFRFITLSRAAFDILAVTAQDSWKVLFSILSFSIVVTMAVYFTGQLTTGFSGPMRLFLQASIGTSVWVIAFFLGIGRFLPTQVENLMNRVVSKQFSFMFGRS